LEEYFVDGFAPNHILRNGFRRIEFWIEGDEELKLDFLSRNGMQRKSERRS
jgi:hypothetical protein